MRHHSYPSNLTTMDPILEADSHMAVPAIQSNSWYVQIPLKFHELLLNPLNATLNLG